MKPVRRIYKLLFIVSLFVLTTCGIYADGFFHFQNFSTDTTGAMTGWYNHEDGNATWTTGGSAGLPYGRDGRLDDEEHSQLATNMNITLNGVGELQFDGRVPDRGMTGYSYWGIWVGRKVVYAGSDFNATENQPFGVQVIKNSSRLDSHNDGSSYAESHRHENGFYFSVFQKEAGILTTNLATFSNIISMYEIYRAQRPTIANPYSTWGYYLSSEVNFNLANMYRPDGQSLNFLTSYGGADGAPLQWLYDDDPEGTGAPTNPTSPQNNQKVGMRIVNDGSKFKFYLNANPESAATVTDHYGNTVTGGLLNEYLLTQQVTATFNTDMNVMIGVESGRPETEMQDVTLDNFLIRSVADGDLADTKVEVTPKSVKTGASANLFKMLIDPTITSNGTSEDAGISEIKIVKPSSAQGWSDTWDLANLKVYTTHGTGTAFNDGTAAITGLNELTRDTSIANCNFSQPVDNQYGACINGDELKIWFRSISVADNDLIYHNSAEKRIAIEFQLDSPSSSDTSGKSFAVFIGNEKYDSSHTDNTTGNNGLRYATTGWQKVLAGDSNTNWTNNSLTVTTVGVPTGYASIVPNILYVGTPQPLQGFVQAEVNENNSDINKVETEITSYSASTPTNGTCASYTHISNSDCGWVEGSAVDLSEFGISGTGFATSLIDGSLSSSISGTKAVMTYSGSGIPGDGGLDKITLNSSATPTVTSPTYYRIKTTVFNTDVSAVTGNLTTTGEPTYFDQYSDYLVLRPEKPKAAAYITENSSCDGETAKVCNNLTQMTYTLTLTNNGKAGNNIQRTQITLPDTITAISSVSINVTQGGSDSFSFSDSSNPAKIVFDNTTGAKSLTVDFEGIGPNNGALGLLGSSTGTKNSATITFTATDSIASLSGDTAISFTGYVDNGNGDALTDNPYSTDGAGTLTITYINPPARGKSEVIRATSFNYSIGNPTGNRELFVTSSDDNLRFTYRLFNPSIVEDPTNVDNNILKALIDLPGGFGTPASVTSAKGATIDISGTQIELTYSTGITPGDFDEITFTSTETNTTKGSNTFSSQVANSTTAPDYKNTANLSSNSNTVKFIYQPLKAVGYTEVIHPAPGFTADDNESDRGKIDISVAYDNSNKLNTLRYHIKNTGLSGGLIKKVRLFLRKDNATGWSDAGLDNIDTAWLATTGSKAFTDVTGSLNSSSAGITCNDDATYSNGYIDCDFTGHANGGIDTGDDAYIEFTMGHLQASMPGGQGLSIRARAINDRSTDYDANETYSYSSETWLPQANSYDHIQAATVAQMASSTESVEFQVAKPRAYLSSYITPNVLLVENSGSTPQPKIFIKNEGVGINHIYRARINVPASWQGKTAVAATSANGAAVTLSSSVITVDYTGLPDCDATDFYTGVGCLKADSGAASIDSIDLTLTHDLTTEDTSTWSAEATNDHTPDAIAYDAATVTSQKSISLYTLDLATARITSSQDVNSSSPGNPTQIYTTNTTPTVVARVINSSATRNIKKILIGHNFMITDIDSSVLGTDAAAFGNDSEAGDAEKAGDSVGDDDGICETNEYCESIILDYASGLSPAGLDDITIQFKNNSVGDVFTTGSHALTFTVVYDDGTTDSIDSTAYDGNESGGDYISFESNVISGGSTSIEFVRPPLPGTAYISNNTTLFNNKRNHLGLNFVGWGNLNGDATPAGDSYDTAVDDNQFSFFITNSSTISGNDMLMTKITAPSSIVSEISQAGTDVSIIKDPNGAPATLTQGANCSTWDFSTGDYCIDDTDPAGDTVLIVKFKGGVVTSGDQIKLSTNITKEPTVTAAANGAFTVEVSNETAGTSLNAVSTPIAEGPDNTDRSLTLYLYEPSVAAQFYVEKTSSAEGEPGDTDMLYKTASAHATSLYIRNTGHAGSEIRQYTIELPVNTLAITGSPEVQISGLTADTNYTCSSGCGAASAGWYPVTANSITFDLNTGSTVSASGSQKVLLRGLVTAATAQSGSSPYPADEASAVADDKFKASAVINSSYTSSTTATKVPGKSEVIYLKQPDPSADSWVYAPDSQLETTGGIPVTTYTYGSVGGDPNYDGTTDKRKLHIVIKNTGNGNNDLRKVRVTVPDIFKLEDAGGDGNDNHVCETGETCSWSIALGEILQNENAGANTVTANSAAAASFTDGVLEVTYSSGEFTPGEVAIYTIPVNYALLDLPDPMPAWSVEVSNEDPANYQTSSIKSGETLTQNFVYPPSSVQTYISEGVQLFALNDSDNSKTLTDLIGSGFQLKYLVKAKGTDLERLAVKIPQSFLSGNVSLDSIATSGGGTLDQTTYIASDVITIDYTGLPGGGLAAGASDTITLTYSGTVNTSDSDSFSFEAYYQTEGVGICNDLATLAGAITSGNTCLETQVPEDGGETANFSISKAPFTSISGKILPIKDVRDENLSVTVSVVDENGNILNDYSSNPLTVNTTAGSGSFSFTGDPQSTGNAIPVCTASGDTYINCTETRAITLRFSAIGYDTLEVPVTINRAQIMSLGDVGTLRIAPFTTGGDENTENLAVARDSANNSCFKVMVPGDGVNETFAVRPECISLSDLTAKTGSLETQNAAGLLAAVTGGSTGFTPPANAGNATMYFIDLEDSQAKDIESIDLLTRNRNTQDLTAEAEITITYDEAAIAAMGYSEGSLAIFSYDPYRKTFMKLGGLVDTDANTVKVSVNTLTRYYGVFSATAGSGFISDVSVSPRLFTPGRGSRHFNRMQLNFSLQEPVDQYKVAIYSIRGTKIIEFLKPGTYKNGQIFWDGYDTTGNLVSGGIYVYVIEAGGNRYRGTVVVAR